MKQTHWHVHCVDQVILVHIIISQKYLVQLLKNIKSTPNSLMKCLTGPLWIDQISTKVVT